MRDSVWSHHEFEAVKAWQQIAIDICAPAAGLICKSGGNGTHDFVEESACASSRIENLNAMNFNFSFLALVLSLDGYFCGIG